MIFKPRHKIENTHHTNWIFKSFVKQEQDKIITNKMGIHVEIFLKKALKQVKCLKNQEKVEPGQWRIHI